MEKSTAYETENLSYRIPSIVTTNSGALVSCCDQRYFTARDNPNRIEKVVRKSVDNGKTWSEIIVAVPELGESQTNASASIDPALLYDKATNTLFMLYSFTPVGVSILNCKQSKGFINGNLILRGPNKKLFYVNTNDKKIYAKDNTVTEFSVDKDGYIFKKNQNVGNIKLSNAYFTVEKTAYLCLIKSTDEGKTWSSPICLNTQLKKNSWGFIGAGPGVGLVLENGKYKGRYIFPIYVGKLRTPPSLSSLAMYSDDQGVTWKLGNFIKKMSKVFSPSWVITPFWTTESQYIELDDGKLMAFIRNHNPKKLIANAYSDNGGESWYGFNYNSYLPHPICQISVIRTKINGKTYVITCNAEDQLKRRLGVIKVSLDDGLTFPYRTVVTEGEFVYSSLTVTKDNRIAVLYEPETLHRIIDFALYTIDELLENKQN